MPGRKARLGHTVERAGVPYGYTVVTWTCGGVLISTHGAPSLLEAYLFLAGACAAFALVARFASGREARGHEPGVAAGVVAAALALGSGGGVAHAVHGRPAYFLVAFAATLVYFVARA
jgi:hypothetical protein